MYVYKNTAARWVGRRNEPRVWPGEALPSDALSFPSPCLCVWGESHVAVGKQIISPALFRACLRGAQQLVLGVKDQGVQHLLRRDGQHKMGWRTYPINTPPANPCQVTCRLPWHALPVCAAPNTCPAPI